MAVLVPDPDVYVEGGTVVEFEAIVLCELSLIAYAIWGIVASIRRRELVWTAIPAYGAAIAGAPIVLMLAIRWFSGG